MLGAVKLPVADKKPSSPASEFIRSRKAEIAFAAKLRKVARHIADLVREFEPDEFAGRVFLQEALRRYAIAIGPWANAVARRTIAEVAARDANSWRKVAAQLGIALRREIETAPTGQAMEKLLHEQVQLITSLPLEAAERVHELTTAGIVEGTRAKEISAKIMETGEVAKSRANLIARTEVARTASVLTQVRAEHVGSTHYEWLTAGDSDVRPDHKILNGRVCAWNDPPIADQRTGARAHPGQIYNCRCIAIPIIPTI